MATTPATEPAGSMNAATRMSGALFNPRATFEDIARKPGWIAPVLVWVILSLVITVSFGRRVGWRGVIEKQMASNSRFQSLPPDQQQTQIEQAMKFAPVFGYVGSVVAPFVLVLIVAAIYLGLFNATSSAGVSFSAAMGITAYAQMPLLLKSLIGLILVFVKDPDTIDIQNLVASNPGALLSNEAPHWQQVLCTSIDVFTLWTLFLIALGFSAANPKKVSMGKAIGIVFGVWIAYLVVRVGIAAI